LKSSFRPAKDVRFQFETPLVAGANDQRESQWSVKRASANGFVTG